MRKSFRKIVALLLVFALSVCYVPMAFAEGEDEGTEPVVTAGDFTYMIVTPEEGEPYAELVKYTGDADSVTIPASFGGTALKVIGHEAFYAVPIKSVSIPEGVEVIDSRAFSNCVKLDNVIFPDSIKTIGDYAFAGCYNAVKAKDPDSGIVATVEETGLSYFHMPESLEVIGDSAFAGCELLVGNAYIASNVEGNADVPALLFPVTLKEIGSDAFAQCRSLVNVVIPEGVMDVKAGTFANCASLERVEIPSTVIHIGPAFNGAFTAHNKLSEYEPILYIMTPHCVIEDSPTIDPHIVVYGARYSSVQAYVDRINAEREDNFYKDYDEFFGIEPEIEYLKFVVIDIPGHDFYGTVTVPTCTERGFTTYICRQCEEKGYYVASEFAAICVPHVCEYTLPLGHAYGDWSDALPASCEASGSKYRICHRELTDTAGNTLYAEDGTTALTCGYRDNRVVPATGHKFIYQITANCTTAGRSWRECMNCGAKKDFKTLPALGHQFDYEHPTTVITELIECDGSGEVGTNGEYIYTCPVCGLTQNAVKAAHPDLNNDYYCDTCDKFIGTSDVSPEGDCSCHCHLQVGFWAFFYKIKLFFWSLFKTNKVCECGIMHY